MKEIANCDIMLVIIGGKWVRTAPEQKSRLLDRDDYVRKEIALAIRLGKEIIPILLEGGRLPDRQSLPEDLQKCPEMQGARVRTERFKGDFLDVCIRAGIVALADATKETPRMLSGKGRSKEVY